MWILALLTFVGFGWLWKKGYLGRNVTPKLVIIAGLIASAWLSSRGQALVGFTILGLACVFSSKDWVRQKVADKVASRSLTEIEARVILGVGLEASRAEILAAHRRKITEVHPDRNPNVSSDMASRVNAARDYLLKRLPPDA